MILIGDHRNKSLSDALGEELGVDVLYPEIHDFADGEFRVRLLADVVDEQVFVLKSFNRPVERSVFEFLFIVDAAHRGGAKSVHALCPYLPYMRADHVFRGGEAVPLEVMISMFESSGVSDIWTIDPHSIKLPEMFDKVPVTDANGMELFAKLIKAEEDDLSQISVVSPDMGGIRRIKQLSEALGGVPFVTVQKDRDLETGELAVAKTEGEVRSDVYIVDDMISTGGTMVQAAESMLEQGAEHAHLVATHAVFAPRAKEILEKAPIERVVVTDSLEVPESLQFQKLEVVSIAGLISNYVRDLLAG